MKTDCTRSCCRAQHCILTVLISFVSQEARASGGVLRLHDRVAITGGRALLANHWTRGFAVAYMGLLHLFVAAVLYRSSAGTTVFVDVLPSPPPPVVIPRSAGLFGR